jgi:hypothetical protein
MLGFKLRDAPLDPARDLSQNIRTKSESRSLDRGQSELKSRPKGCPLIGHQSARASVQAVQARVRPNVRPKALSSKADGGQAAAPGRQGASPRRRLSPPGGSRSAAALGPRSELREPYLEKQQKSNPAEFGVRCVTYRTKPMRTIAYALALALGVAFATSAFAADVTTAKTKADCDKVGGMWDAKTNTCKSKM